MLTGSARIVFVSGKGGTGKSFVAEALAAYAARERCLRVALVRVRPPFGEPGDDGQHEETTAAGPAHSPGFRTIVLDERETLEKFLGRVLRVGFVARRLLDSRTFRAVAAAAPGLRDLVTLTAITALASAGRRRSVDLVVVDAPASGHSVPLLTSPVRVLDLAPLGPVAREARAALQTVTDRQSFVPLIVTIPEELAVTEAVTLYEELVAEGIPAPRIVVNCLWPGHLDDAHVQWLVTRRPSLDALLHHKRRQRQLEQLATLERKTGKCMTLPFTFGNQLLPAAAIAALLDSVLAPRS